LIRGSQIDKELASLSGWLYPAGEDVQLPCELGHPDDVAVMIGTNAYIANRFPHTAISVNCDRVVSIDKDVNGRVGVTMTIVDRDGRVIVELDHGRFKVNSNNYFRIERHGSRSTLSVVDQFNREVLYLHLPNKNVLQLRALFNYRGVPIRFDDSRPFGNMMYSCFEGNALADILIGECLIR
jgi:hypothetical protein